MHPFREGMHETGFVRLNGLVEVSKASLPSDSVVPEFTEDFLVRSESLALISNRDDVIRGLEADRQSKEWELLLI